MAAERQLSEVRLLGAVLYFLSQYVTSFDDLSLQNKSQESGQEKRQDFVKIFLY